jgi:PncC family amidohydrolase
VTPIEDLRSAVEAAAAELRNGGQAPGSAPTLERPKKAGFGDFSTNAAMLLAPALKAPPREIAEKLGAAGQTLAVAESSAGGLVSASLLSVAGASRYYRGGFVTYTHDGTRAALADATDLEPGDRGACEQFARFLATAAKGKLGSDWAVSETGATGPTGNRYGDPAGHAWVAVAGPDGLLRTQHILTGSDDRGGNMQLFAAAALGLLVTTLG